MSLYIRPFMFGTDTSIGLKPPCFSKLVILLTPVGSYFIGNFEDGISLLADPSYIRAWPGGMGNLKTGCNYGPSIYLQKHAKEKFNCDQILWLFNDLVTECGSMNFFVLFKHSNGTLELVTPELNEIILPGITRNSVLQIAKQYDNLLVSERRLTFQEIEEASYNNQILEMFGTGTATVIVPIKRILSNHVKIEINSKFTLATKIYNDITDIQYGRVDSSWTDVKIPK